MIYPKFAKIKWNTSKEPKMILAKIADALPWYAKPVYSAKNKLNLTFNPEHDIIYWNDLIAKEKPQGLNIKKSPGEFFPWEISVPY